MNEYLEVLESIDTSLAWIVLVLGFYVLIKFFDIILGD